MTNGRNRQAAFTLAEIMVVVVIIGVLVALLLPALLKGQDAAVRGEAQSRVSDLGLALDSFYNAFGHYPPTNRAFNPASGRFDDGPVFGDYGYSEALVHCLTSKFVKGLGDEGPVFDPLNANDVKRIQGTQRIIGRAPVGIGPLMELKTRDLVDFDGDGWPELADPWGNPFIYIPLTNYFDAGGAYNAGALTPVDYTGDGLADPVDPTQVVVPNIHYQRFKFQIISLGPDAWTPGLSPAPGAHGHRYFDITIGGNPYAGAVNPALVGTDNDMSKPVVEPLLGHTEGTADDISNLKG